MITWRICDPNDPHWTALIDAHWARLRVRGAALLPDHFVKATFAKIGGKLLELWIDGDCCALGLLFPRDLVAGEPHVTLRLHALRNLPDEQQLLDSLSDLAAPGTVRIYRPSDGCTYTATHYAVGQFDIGAPSAEELAAVRRLHAEIWGGGDEARYPNDLHSAEFAPGTSLIARAGAEIAGFLLGFVRFGGPEALRAVGVDTAIGIESQVMGIAPHYRRFGLAATLKREQARLALDRGISLIRWTADPLQFANATLNFAKLRAVCGEIYPNYYPFRNALNRVPASRLALTWLPASQHGRRGLVDAPTDRSLKRYPGVSVLNDGPRILDQPGAAPAIALEIPPDWTHLQHDDEPTALAWRATSDHLLGAYLGFQPDRYILNDVAIDGERRYLIGVRFRSEFID